MLFCTVNHEAFLIQLYIGDLLYGQWLFLLLQMYTNALVQRASMMALHGEMEKCHTCFTKALAIDPNCADVYIYRARVSGLNVCRLNVCSYLPHFLVLCVIAYMY